MEELRRIVDEKVEKTTEEIKSLIIGNMGNVPNENPAPIANGMGIGEAERPARGDDYQLPTRSLLSLNGACEEQAADDELSKVLSKFEDLFESPGTLPPSR
ncbi:hypothetical protein HAX54_004613, partial [Datura stramonium]|nr:hypothetical protein [Datura stramonium]